MELRIHTRKPYTALSSDDNNQHEANSENLKTSTTSQSFRKQSLNITANDATTTHGKDNGWGEEREPSVKSFGNSGRGDGRTERKKEEDRKDSVESFPKDRKRSDVKDIGGETERAHTAKIVTDSRTTKMAFGDSAQSSTLTQRLNVCPHIVLLLLILTGTLSILGSAGSGQWMTADVNGVTVYYGLFERCVISTSDVTSCDAFDWPGWLPYTSQDKMEAVKVMAIFSILFASLFLLGLLVLLVSGACGRCHGYKRKVFVIVVDICFWLMVTSGGVSSLLFLTGVDSVEAYPQSTLLWPPVIYCLGWCTALICRLLIAACCDVHRDVSALL